MPDAPRVRLVDAIAEVEPARWNALLEATAPGHPFLRHEFLASLEASGCVGAETGWQPCHALLETDDGLAAAAPLYLKGHSFGEFVFDFAWADAYHRLGLDYYPKLVCAVPFTPVVGPRLLAADAHARDALAHGLCRLPAELSVSSLHLLFGHAPDRAALEHAGALQRRDCHYRWYNRGYRDFDDFLSVLPSKRRKEIRRERRRLADAGIQVRVLAPDEVDADLARQLYAFYARTYHLRGQQPYLSRDFFGALARRMPEQVRFFVAFGDDQPLGMAFTLVGADTLYGRHWGCAMDLDGLHFETCYYAGIDYCIRHGLAAFDAGAQGEHKLRRGFEPIATYSAHVLRDSRLQRAIADFVAREGEMMAEAHAEQRAHSAFPDAADLAP